MTLKLCFDNEIHRCSDLPPTLSGLYSILPETFKTSLPSAFKLTYTLPNEIGNVSLTINTQEEYEDILKKASSKPIKVFIEPTNTDYDIIQAKQKVEDNQHKELVDKATEALMPQVKKQSYFDYQPTQEEQIRKIVKETLHEQLPSIISLVKEAVLRELRQAEQPAGIIEVPVHQELLKVEPPRPEVHYEEAKNEEKQHVIAEQLDANELVHTNQAVIEARPEALKVEPILNQVKNFGFSLKDKLAGLPGIAINAIDELSQKIEGDPYIGIEEGRYNKSVITKADGLKDIFPEEERKSLLEFVKLYPKHATLEQLANAFLAKDQPAEPADIADN